MLLKQVLSGLSGGCHNAMLRSSSRLTASPTLLTSRSYLGIQSRSRKQRTTITPKVPTTRFISNVPSSAALPVTTPIIESDPHPLDLPYSPPTTGLLSKLPASWVPYAELARLDKPTGTYYLFFPCLFSTLMGAQFAIPMASPAAVIGTTALFFTGALVMRGAGCAVNDLWDKDLDPHVRRTRLRPIARGAISPFQGLVFTGGTCMTGLAILLQFPTQCLWYGIPSLALVAIYPLMKRITNYPQAVLGLTFSWGAWMGFPALGVDLLANSQALTTAGLLYASNISWTILYDMIYAHMDIKDDAKAGIKSIALAHDKDTKKVLSGLAVIQVGLLSAAGIVSGAGPAFFVGSVGGTALTLAYMIRKVDLKSVRDCWWWFVNGCWITGGTLASGLAVDYAIRYYGREEEELSEDVAGESRRKNETGWQVLRSLLYGRRWIL